MKMILALGLLALVPAAAFAQDPTVEGCVTVGDTCEYDASSSGSISGSGDWKVEVWWNTTCASKQGDPDWMVASAGRGPTNPGQGHGGVAGYWEGSVTDEHAVSCVKATALSPTSSVAIGNFSALPED